MVLRCASLFLATLPLVAQEPSLETLRAEGHWKQLRPRIEGWHRAQPGDPQALLWMSRVKQAFGDPQGALELVRKAAALAPADAAIQAQLAMAAGETAGQAEGKMKQFSLAREMKKATETALAGNPGDPDATKLLVLFHLQAPGIIGGSEAKAKELVQQLTQLKPLEGLLLQAELAFLKKDLEGARALIQQALTKGGNLYRAHTLMASYHLRQKPQALDAALASYRQALVANPKGIQAHSQIASILAEQGKWAELDACLAQARKADPENLVPYYSAGRNLLEENRNLDRAEALLRTYLSQPPEGGAPDHAAAHWRLGLLFEKQGKKQAAIQALEQALMLRPGFKSAEKDLKRLKA